MCSLFVLYFIFFFKQKTAYEMRISDWSSDVCSSDLAVDGADALGEVVVAVDPRLVGEHREMAVHTEDLRQQLLSEAVHRSEEHTSELQSLMRISYAVFCFKKKTDHKNEQAQSVKDQLNTQ